MKATIDGLQQDNDQASWGITTARPNWQVKTDYHLVRWDDVVESSRRRRLFSFPLGVIAFLVSSGLAHSGFTYGFIADTRFLSLSVFMFGALILTAGLAGMLGFRARGLPAVAIVPFRRVRSSSAGPWHWWT